MDDNIINLLGPRNPGAIDRAEYTASLRVMSASLTLAELTLLLGPPTNGHDTGDPVSRHRSESSKRTQTLWLLESAADGSTPLEQQIDELVTFAEGRREVLDGLRSRCSIDIACGIVRGEVDVAAALPGWAVVLGCGTTLDPELLSRLASLRLGLWLDIY